MSNIVPYSDIEKMAIAVAKSGLFNVKKPEEAMALMLVAQAEGSHPAIAARDYHVIQGRPSLKADAMMARFQQAGGKVEWKEYTDERVTGVFSHPAGGSLAITWTIKMASDIGLVKPGSGWHKYPRAMLRARCISEGIRSVYPGCVAGVYTPEEVQDMEPEKPAQEVDMGQADVVVEEVKKSQERKEGEAFLPLYIPHQTEEKPQLHSEYTDLFAWEIGFHDLVNRVKATSAYTDDVKRTKLKQFKEMNAQVIDKLDAPTKMKVVAAANSLEAA
jgi:hypothetical protein